VLQGTAAVGAALGYASVSITDSSGAPACTEAPITTSGAGNYSCTLQTGRSAPFVIVVTDPSGAQAPLVSIGTETPAAGASLTLNATTLTTAIVGQLSPDGDALSVASTPALIDTATLATINTRVLAQLANVLTALGAPVGYDPFTTPIVAASASVSGNTADQVIDLLRISVVNGVTTVSTVDNAAAAVPLASGTTSPPALPAPSASVISLAEALRLLAPVLNNCFALPVASRVVTADGSIPAAQGGPEVTAVAPACEDIAHPSYLHNGYRSGQAFYGLLNDATMVGASFRPPESMRFIEDATAADNDRVVINLRYIDANGVAGNLITVAQKFPGSATTDHPTDWWLYGNQQPVDTAIRAYLRRLEQLAPSPGTGVFANAPASRFETGIEVFVNKNGPGSTGMRAARITGPGLPSAGLVMTQPDPAIITSQSWLNILRKDGATGLAEATPAPDVGNIFRLQRTLGLTGADATSIRANPNAGNTNSTAFMNWAHPLDYGLAPGATDYIDFSAMPANSLYQVELFYAGETAARYTFTKTLLTPVVPATRAANLQWVALADDTRQYLDPAHARSAATTSVALSWLANPYAETVGSAGVYTFGNGVHVDQGLVGVARGATSATATAPGTPYPLLTNDGSSTRILQLRYRMLDGSYKDMTTRYN
jgi:hypothetical protein